jgi:hypothetical protein
MEENRKALLSDESAQWYWSEGGKYVIEGAKSLFWLNGGAAAGMLTFLGNEKAPITFGLRAAIIVFAFGSLLAAALFMSAYMTQLNYGNQNLSQADRWHFASYVLFGLSVIFFAAGVIVTALSLK